MFVLSAYHVTDTILGPGDTGVKKTDKNLCLHEAGILLQKMANSQINM